MIGRREYEIKQCFKSLEIGERYFKNERSPKRDCEKRFFNCSLSDENFKGTIDDNAWEQETFVVSSDKRF